MLECVGNIFNFNCPVILIGSCDRFSRGSSQKYNCKYQIKFPKHLDRLAMSISNNIIIGYKKRLMEIRLNLFWLPTRLIDII